MIYSDEHFMQQALKEAQYAYDEEEIPIGAIITMDNKIIARGRNSVEKLNDPTAHAEVLAITSACNYLGSKYLVNATLYVTIEPCHMCAGALYWSKLSRIVFGAFDVKNGYQHFCGERNPFHPKTTLHYGVLADDCALLMKNFFKARR